MKVAVQYQNERIDLEVVEDRLVAQWRGPTGLSASETSRLALEVLENPRDFPPLRQAVVPGDRVSIALDPEVPEAAILLEAIGRTLQGAGVDPDSVTVVVPPGSSELPAVAIPAGMKLAVHDPEDRNNLAYLANTSQGRRVYLNRQITDADFVLPVGRLGYDPVLGYRGPWSAIDPALSDLVAARAYRARSTEEPPQFDSPRAALTESSEVGWLLGSQFHVGVVPGASGVAEFVSGLASDLLTQGARAVDRAWGFRAESRAELVVAGIGRPGLPTRIDDLAQGLATASRLVQRGGKIVVLSRTEGPIGPSLRRLCGADDIRDGLALLKGHESDPDNFAARRLARALAWADVYLLSDLSSDDVDGLSMIALEHPDEARRLVKASGSYVVLSQADQTRAEVADEA